MEKGNIKGLTSQEVNDRIVKNLVNYVDEPKTKTIKEIVKSNVFTYFNFLNIFLGTLVIISGIVSGRILYALKNCLFVGVIFTNTIISIAEEITNTAVCIAMLSVNMLATIAKRAPIPSQNTKNPTVIISTTKNTPAAINQKLHICIPPNNINHNNYYTIKK